MQIQRVHSANINYSNQVRKINKNLPTGQPSFKAVLLKDNILLKYGINCEQSIKAALIELELEPRELIADRRYRHRDLIPKELKENFYTKRTEIINFLDSIIPKEDYYTGDFAFLGALSARKPLQFYQNPIQSTLANAMEGNQYPNMQYPNFITLKECWEKSSSKKFDTHYNEHGLLRKELADYITNSASSEKAQGGKSVENTPTWILMNSKEPIQYSSNVNADNLVYNAHKTMRQRVLMLVEPSKDGTYRYLSPSTKVYGMAEIYTDRVGDILEDILKEHKQQDNITINSILERFKIKHINPTHIVSLLVPLNIHEGCHRGITTGYQRNVNSILDIENCKDAAAILLDSIANKSKIAGTTINGGIETIPEHTIAFLLDYKC